MIPNKNESPNVVKKIPLLLFSFGLNFAKEKN
jgi:hypothetical protein